MGIFAGMATLTMAAAIASAPDDMVTATARIAATELEEGESYEIVVEIKVKEGFSASEGGMPAPLLQIEVPESVKLLGKEYQSYRELARHEFLQEPYERLLSDLPARIGFELLRAPRVGDVFALNILAYVGAQTQDDAYFVRRRLRLKVAGGAEAESVKTVDSSWGREDLLQIGDMAELFTLPKASGDTVALVDVLGKKNIIVTTYRAHW